MNVWKVEKGAKCRIICRYDGLYVGMMETTDVFKRSYLSIQGLFFILNLSATESRSRLVLNMISSNHLVFRFCISSH